MNQVRQDAILLSRVFRNYGDVFCDPHAAGCTASAVPANRANNWYSRFALPCV